MDARELERAVGAVLLPEVRLAGTRPGAFSNPQDVRPSRAYLERFAPAGLVLFARGSAGPGQPAALLAEVRAELASLGQPAAFAACDLEQGAGHHWADATRLPPAMALASAALNSGHSAAGAALLRSAGAITAREARERGVELVLAPVADVNTASDNPIIAVRSFGADAARVAEQVLAFHEGLLLGGTLGTAKHFPGHGAAHEDSHTGLPLIADAAPGAAQAELEPFRALIAGGLAAVMSAHIDRPSLTGEAGLPTTLSRRVLVDLLRAELGFAGAVLSDAMDMGALASVAHPHARAIAAGCDGLLCPRDPLAAAEELLAAVACGELSRARLAEAAARMQALRARALAVPAPNALKAAVATGAIERAVTADSSARQAFALECASRALRLSTARWSWKLGGPCEVLAPLHQARGLEARALINELRTQLATSHRPRGVLLPVVLEVGAGLGTYRPGSDQLAEIDGKLSALIELGWPVGLLWLGSPQTLPEAWWGRPEVPVLLAYGANPPMLGAVRRFLEGRVVPGGFLASPVG